MTRLIATFGYVGLAPKAPGTFGSLAALPVAVLIYALGGFVTLLIATIAVFFLGWWATERETAGADDHDPSEIVIDEVAGQWIALFPLAGGLWWMGHGLVWLPWPGLVFGFLFFRLFDIWKPWPVSWADRKETAFGVMLDDVLAGVMAALATGILGAVAHGILR